MVSDLTVDADAMQRAAAHGHPTATDLADWLVLNLKKPFREAHKIAGRAVARAEVLKVPLEKLPLAELQRLEPGITADARSVLTLEASVNARTSEGGTAPIRVKEQVRLWKERLG
jgi:argininosuccinate lyase